MINSEERGMERVSEKKDPARTKGAEGVEEVQAEQKGRREWCQSQHMTRRSQGRVAGPVRLILSFSIAHLAQLILKLHFIDK